MGIMLTKELLSVHGGLFVAATLAKQFNHHYQGTG